MISLMQDTALLAVVLVITLVGIRTNPKIFFIGGAIVGLVLGWRGISPVGTISFYPSEVLIIGGFIFFLLSTITRRRTETFKVIPFPAWVLLGTALLAIITGQTNHHDTGYILLEAKSFLIFLPLIVMVGNWIQDKNDIYPYVTITILVGAVIAGLGLAGQYLPGLSNLLPGLFSPQRYERLNFQTGSVVELANFSSWGTPVVAVLLVLILGLCAIPLAKSRKRLPWVVVTMVIILGIIASGYRSAWLGAGVVVIGLIFTMNKKIATILFAGIVIVSSMMFSQAYLDRVYSINPRNTIDHSLILRQNALRYSINVITQHPITGTGWASPTSFNDWIYLGVTQGVVGLAVFFLWYVLVIVRLARDVFRSEEKTMAIGFSIGLCGYAIAMVSGAMSQVLPIWSGFWVVFCLAWQYTEIRRLQQGDLNGQAVYSGTNF